MSFAAILLSSCSSVEALKVPNGKYYDSVGLQEAYIEVANSSIVGGTCGGRGCPEFKKSRIVASDDASSSILVQTPWGQQVSYCVKTAELEDALTSLQEIASSRSVFASCDMSLGWLYSYEMNTECESGSISVPCNVDVEKKKVIIGGFQAAPVFELISKTKAVNSASQKFDIIQSKEYADFVPDNGEGSTLRVYDLKL